MENQPERIKWGIIGTGAIAHTFAQALAKSRTGRLVAVGSRTLASAEAFSRKFPSPHACGSYEALLAEAEVEAVYLAMPHSFHAEWCLQAIRAGKHVLCEKPFTLNHAEALMVAQAAAARGVFLMEAFMYRCHPQTARLIQLIQAGAIGQVGVIQAAFSFQGEYRAESRLFNNALGGGGILDVGCYTTSIARLVAGAARGLPFADPERIAGYAKLHPETGTDLYAVASLQFPGGILANVSAGVGLNQEMGLRVFGSEGSLHLPTPFVMAREGGTTSLLLTRNGSDRPEEIVIETPEYLYALEADAVGDALARGWRESPHMPVADTLGNMATLDAWRASAGVVYASERSRPSDWGE